MFIRLSIFQKNYNLIAIDIGKQQALGNDWKAIQEINFTGYLDEEIQYIFFILEEVK